MHVLGHSFSQKRKCNRPRDLQIRKVSFSGSSLSDGSLSSSSTSTASAGTAIAPSQYHTSPAPVFASPTNAHAPLRLYERPFKSSRHHPIMAAGASAATFYYADSAISSDDDEDYYGSIMGDDEDDEKRSEFVEVEGTQFHMELPPHAEHIEADTPEAHERSDYFFFQHVTKRPSMPKSRWSESTIQTLDMATPGSSIHDDYEEDEDKDVLVEEEEEDMETPTAHVDVPPNFSYKYQRTVSAPEARRPTMPAKDSVEEFIKRGGWKRRGIVFDRREIGMRDSDCFTVI